MPIVDPFLAASLAGRIYDVVDPLSKMTFFKEFSSFLATDNGTHLTNAFQNSTSASKRQ